MQQYGLSVLTALQCLRFTQLSQKPILPALMLFHSILSNVTTTFTPSIIYHLQVDIHLHMFHFLSQQSHKGLCLEAVAISEASFNSLA